MRKHVFNPLVGDTQAFVLHYLNANGESVHEDFTDLILAQKRARQLYREGAPNAFKILTITTQLTVFEPRTTREMSMELLEKKQREALQRREDIQRCPTEDLKIDSDLFLA